jgi:hypothetical protein
VVHVGVLLTSEPTLWEACLAFVWEAIRPLAIVASCAVLVVDLVPPLGQHLAPWWSRHWLVALLAATVVSLTIEGGQLLR